MLSSSTLLNLTIKFFCHQFLLLAATRQQKTPNGSIIPIRSKMGLKESKQHHEVPGNLPKYCQRRLLRSSTVFLPVALVAYSTENYLLGSAAFLVYVTSNIYWRRPTYGLRRMVDMIAVFIVTMLHLSYAILTPVLPIKTKAIYLMGFTATFAFYMGARIIDDPDISSRCHQMVHFCSSLSGIYLYGELYRFQ